MRKDERYKMGDFEKWLDPFSRGGGEVNFRFSSVLGISFKRGVFYCQVVP